MFRQVITLWCDADHESVELPVYADDGAAGGCTIKGVTDGTYTVEDIQAFCDEYGITLKITYVQNESHEVGAIIYQSRKEGYTVARGTTLTIKVVEETSVEENPEVDICNPLEEDCENEG